MNKAEKEFIKCNGPRNRKTILRAAFINCRKLFDKTLRNAERNYKREKMAKIDEVCTQNPKEFWRTIKRLGPKRDNAIPTKVRAGEDLIENETMVLNTWQNEFQNLYNPPHAANFDNTFLEEVKQTLLQKEDEMSRDTYEENEEVNRPITFDEIERVVSKLKTGKAFGIDGIPNEVLCVN